MADKMANADGGADPARDIKQQNSGDTTIADIAADDPDKVKKMTTDHQRDAEEAGEE